MATGGNIADCPSGGARGLGPHPGLIGFASQTGDGSQVRITLTELEDI